MVPLYSGIVRAPAETLDSGDGSIYTSYQWHTLFPMNATYRTSGKIGMCIASPAVILMLFA